MYLTLISELGNKYVVDPEKQTTYNFAEGEISLKNISPPTYIKSSKGINILVIEATHRDLFEKKFKRGAQIIHEKDIGWVMRKFYLNDNMKILEAGAGSGHATCFLSKIAKEIITYEKEKRFYEIAKHNISLIGSENITLINDSVKACNKSNYFDLVLFDFKEAGTKEYLEIAKRALKLGGYVVLYLPVIEQVIESIKNLKELEFKEIEINEILLRKWKPSPLRPENIMLGHTAFIVSARKF